MGLINHDPYMVTYSGTTATDTYLHVGSSSIQIERSGADTYRVFAPVMVHYSVQASTDGRPIINIENVNFEVSNAVISSTPVYTLVFDHLKTLFPNHTDTL